MPLLRVTPAAQCSGCPGSVWLPRQLLASAVAGTYDKERQQAVPARASQRAPPASAARRRSGGRGAAGARAARGRRGQGLRAHVRAQRQGLREGAAEASCPAARGLSVLLARHCRVWPRCPRPACGRLAVLVGSCPWRAWWGPDGLEVCLAPTVATTATHILSRAHAQALGAHMPACRLAGTRTMCARPQACSTRICGRAQGPRPRRARR